ncbi:Complex I intermediate-associated protein 30 (CIA30) [Halopseudomonas xinjiangensis]|uniref:Complex I intermediate-associated protein 30 (CIA30) n=1 Tax=Halopseudomonas xinjiangensis TaxID=487184 RepID=A0A1H1SSE8_9GAMM|nr:CIA30 family protein [Halopseudomonas xinjiangensis]SDS50855.1 Complex I intermediate-associated protein 30 (CIA30) [Halopseudomonas xinjiangensis]
MNDHLHIAGPDIPVERLIDVYQAGRDHPSPWVPITDQVMGGISTAELRQGERHGSVCTCLSGRTRLENNGGFVQMKLDIGPSWSPGDYAGVFIELCGAAHDYDLSIKTSQLERPWQSFRYTLPVEPQWTRFVVPYEALRPHRTEAELDPATIRSVAGIGIGTAFDVDVCVRRFGFYR